MIFRLLACPFSGHAQEKRVPADSLCCKDSSYTVALKTNLLYDAVTVLNASAEFPLGGGRFSILVEDTFPWWSFGPNRNKYCIQLWEIGIEPRWWFKTDGIMQGHFLGIYGKSATYDFQFDRALCYQGTYWSAGASYGYSMKIGEKLQMEFSLSVGFMQSHYRHYQPDDNYDHLYIDKYNSGKLTYIGPTKAAISLVWPITFRQKDRKNKENPHTN